MMGQVPKCLLTISKVIGPVLLEGKNVILLYMDTGQGRHLSHVTSNI